MIMYRAAAALALGASMLAVGFLLADTPPAAGTGAVVNLTATSANVSGAPDPIRIEILRWSTEAERARLMDAWNLKTASPPSAGAGKGAGKAGRGAGKSAAASADRPPVTPESALATALQETATVGYLWSSEITGYALRFASKVANRDGSQRITLITQRRLGAVNQQWSPVSGAAQNHDDFSLIELHLSAKGMGEGKVSLTGKVVPDPAGNLFKIENYDALPVVLGSVGIQKGKP